MSSTSLQPRKPFLQATNEDINSKLSEVARPTDELVIGLVGAVGAGVSKTATEIRNILVRDFGYEVEIIKASDLIRTNADKTSTVSPAQSGAKRVTDLQKVGTELRQRFGEEYIAAKIIERIAVRRVTSGGYDETTEVPQPSAVRHATIVDSFKHPKETALFRSVYGGIFWQFTVFAPENIRELRLQQNGVNKSELSGIFTRFRTH